MDLNPSSSEPSEAIVAETQWAVFRASKIHGVGGFARSDIPAGTRLIEYRGEKITKKESLARCERNNENIFALDDEHDLDGNVSWNPARFLNHSCEPNCEALLEDGRIWVMSIRNITAWEELTFNYSYDLEDYREHRCSCGAPGCVGYIVAEEFFEHLRRKAMLIRSDPDGAPGKHGLNQY